MNNTIERNKKTTLTILISTWAVALILIVLGAILPSVQKDGYPELVRYDTRYDTVESYSYCTYKFTASSSNYYTLKIDDARLENVEDSQGNQTGFSYTSASGWDYAFRIYLSSGETYYFEIFTYSSEISITIS